MEQSHEKMKAALSQLSETTRAQLIPEGTIDGIASELASKGLRDAHMRTLVDICLPVPSAVGPGMDCLGPADDSVLKLCTQMRSESAAAFRLAAHIDCINCIQSRRHQMPPSETELELLLVACAHAAGDVDAGSASAAEMLWRDDSSIGAALVLVQTFIQYNERDTKEAPSSSAAAAPSSLGLVRDIARSAHSHLANDESEHSQLCRSPVSGSVEKHEHEQKKGRAYAVAAAECVRYLLYLGSDSSQILHRGSDECLMDSLLRVCMPCLLLAIDHQSPRVKRSGFDALAFAGEHASRSELRAHASVAIDALCRRVHGCESMNWPSVCRAISTLPCKADSSLYDNALLARAARELVTETSRRQVTSDNGLPFLRSLTHMTQRLGLRTLRLLDDLIPLILAYIGRCTDGNTQANAIALLRTVTIVTWPRAKSNAPSLVRLLSKEVANHGNELSGDAPQQLKYLLDTLMNAAGHVAMDSAPGLADLRALAAD